MTTPDISPALIAGLAVEAEKLSAEGQRLSAELHQRGEELQAVAIALTGALDALRRYRRLVVALAVVAAVSMAGLGVIAAINLRNGAVIRSCTEPTGKCFKRNQDQGAILVACANRYPKDVAAIRACVATAEARLK